MKTLEPKEYKESLKTRAIDIVATRVYPDINYVDTNNNKLSLEQTKPYIEEDYSSEIKDEIINILQDEIIEIKNSYVPVFEFDKLVSATYLKKDVDVTGVWRYKQTVPSSAVLNPHDFHILREVLKVLYPDKKDFYKHSGPTIRNQIDKNPNKDYYDWARYFPWDINHKKQSFLRSNYWKIKKFTKHLCFRNKRRIMVLRKTKRVK